MITDFNLNSESMSTALAVASLVVIDFWAPWCSHCLAMNLELEELAANYTGNVMLGKVNVDAEKALARSYGVMSIPTLIFFRNGTEIKRLNGVHTAQELADLLNTL